jgi:hypothetical protein
MAVSHPRQAVLDFDFAPNGSTASARLDGDLSSAHSLRVHAAHLVWHSNRGAQVPALYYLVRFPGSASLLADEETISTQNTGACLTIPTCTMGGSTSGVITTAGLPVLLGPAYVEFVNASALHTLPRIRVRPEHLAFHQVQVRLTYFNAEGAEKPNPSGVDGLKRMVLYCSVE